MAEEKEVIVEEKGTLAKFFDNKAVKGVESALLVGAAYFLITFTGMPADFVSAIIVTLAGILGLDSVATIVSLFKKNKKEEDDIPTVLQKHVQGESPLDKFLYILI